MNNFVHVQKLQFDVNVITDVDIIPLIKPSIAEYNNNALEVLDQTLLTVAWLPRNLKIQIPHIRR
jgi:hypothetical protein